MKTLMYLEIYLLLLIIIALVHTSPGKYHQNRILNGHPINITQANYYTRLFCNTTFVCGGTILKRNRVITAAHCIENCNIKNYTLIVGMNSNSELSTATKYKVSEIKLHPKYNTTNISAYDVAIIFVSTNITFNAKVGSIQYANFVPQVGSFIRVFGYGLTENHTLSQTLRTTKMEVIKKSGTVFITNANTTSVLSGDSGGPAVYKGQLVGVITCVTYNVTEETVMTLFNKFVECGNPEIYNFIRNNVENIS